MKYCGIFNIEDRTITGGGALNGHTILHIACAYRDIEIIDLVFDALEKVNSDIDFDTRAEGALPMHHSCMNKNSAAAIHLLRRYPEKINVLNNDWFHEGWHVLHYACAYGHLKVIKYLLGDQSLNIDINLVDHVGRTPLHIACFHGQYEVVKFLLENSKEIGIDITKKTISQETAEDCARNSSPILSPDYTRSKEHQDIVDLFEAHRKVDDAEPNQPV